MIDKRRMFYINVGNLPKNKAEEYMRSIIAKHRNKIVYDASTGDKTDSRHSAVLEWLINMMKFLG